MQLNQLPVQQLQQKQIQTLAVQQIQSLKILQLAVQDLHLHIQEEMASNPALEIGNSPNDDQTMDAGDPLEERSDFGEQLLGDPLSSTDAPGNTEDEGAAQAAEHDEFIAGLVQMEENWRDYMPAEHTQSLGSRDDEEKRNFFFNSLVARQTITDELLEQLHTLTDIDKEMIQLGEIIIGNLDERGYLRTPPDELARLARVAEEKMLAALHLVQDFDPPGIAAQNLRECLLIQLRRQGKEQSVAARIVDSHLDLVARNRIPELAKKLKLPLSTINEALQEIRRLQPHPGNSESNESEPYILPEVFIEKDENGAYKVRSNRDTFPRLRISPLYLKLLQDPETSAETQAYLREKINSAKQLMYSLSQRKSTIHRITEILVEKQYDFLETGEEALRPLTMMEVAEEIGVHETTVSRAIANKYVQTPRGLYPLRFFFSSASYASGDGDEVSASAIKSKIQALISEEDTRHPYSDQKLAKLLAVDGLKVARRTVAKYREALGIPPSNLRKTHGAL